MPEIIEEMLETRPSERHGLSISDDQAAFRETKKRRGAEAERAGTQGGEPGGALPLDGLAAGCEDPATPANSDDGCVIEAVLRGGQA